MQPFYWNDYYLTGIQLIDEQHHHLVNLINRFGEQIANNDYSEHDLAKLFDELQDYAIYHFTEEEQLMVSSHVDPRHVSIHKKVHQSFLTEVTVMYEEISTNMETRPEELFDFLVNWLAFHILGEDKNLSRQLSAISSGDDPAVAFDQFQIDKDKSKEPLLVALHSLFEQLSVRNAKLRELNQNLEEKVVERTKKLAEANQQLEHIAYIDVLTTLPNRRSTMNYLQSCWESGEDLSVLMMDADHFKEVNDKFGHDQGDKVLIELSRCLEDALRNDDFVGRLGGDEFLVIGHANQSGATQLAEKVLSQVNRLTVSVADGEAAWKGSISIGYATRMADTDSTDSLIKLADKSVYLAKQAGKNCIRSIQSKN